MTELEFLKHFEKHIKVTLRNGNVVEGFCSSFCRSNDDPSGRANITIDSKQDSIVINYEDVKEIEIITP